MTRDRLVQIHNKWAKEITNPDRVKNFFDDLMNEIDQKPLGLTQHREKLRDYFAGQALSNANGDDYEQMAKDCYGLADAMLIERANGLFQTADAAWVPVSKRLPEVTIPRKIHDGYWVFRHGMIEEKQVYWETLHPSHWEDEGKISLYPITHWLDMNLPEPPQEIK